MLCPHCQCEIKENDSACPCCGESPQLSVRGAAEASSTARSEVFVQTKPEKIVIPLPPEPSREVILIQDKVAVYERPFSEASVVVILEKASVFTLVDAYIETPEGWYRIQTQDNQQGFIKARTRVANQEQLLAQWRELKESKERGPEQMLKGSGWFLGSCVVAGLTMLLDFIPVIIIPLGGICYGTYLFFHGWEQIFNSRFTLREFEKVYQRSLPKSQESHRYANLVRSGRYFDLLSARGSARTQSRTVLPAVVAERTASVGRAGTHP